MTRPCSCNMRYTLWTYARYKVVTRSSTCRLPSGRQSVADRGRSLRGNAHCDTSARLPSRVAGSRHTPRGPYALTETICGEAVERSASERRRSEGVGASGRSEVPGLAFYDRGCERRYTCRSRSLDVCVYTYVVESDTWPRSSVTAMRSATASSRCVAKLCRREWALVRAGG